MYCRRRKSKHSSDNFGVSRAESHPEIFQVDRATTENERGFHLHYLFDCRQYFVTIRVMLILRGPKTFFFTCCRTTYSFYSLSVLLLPRDIRSTSYRNSAHSDFLYWRVSVDWSIWTVPFFHSASVNKMNNDIWSLHNYTKYVV